MRICVYGSASTELDQVYTDTVYELGVKMAKEGIGMVYGGGAQGVMGAAAQGMYDNGGDIIGVSPEFFDVDGVLFKHCTRFIYTKDMRERKKTMEDLADAFIVAPGGFGTLEEFFEILTAKQLERHNKAIVVLNTAGYYDTLLDFISIAMDQNFIKEACKKLYYVCGNVDEALSYIKSYEPHAIGIKKLRDVGSNTSDSFTYDSFKR